MDRSEGFADLRQTCGCTCCQRFLAWLGDVLREHLWPLSRMLGLACCNWDLSCCSGWLAAHSLVDEPALAEWYHCVG